VAEGERYIHELAAILNAHLSGRTWILGEGLSFADFALAAWLPAAGPLGIPVNTYREIDRWYRSIEALPGWREAMPPPPT